jgi:hypothetical protein
VEWIWSESRIRCNFPGAREAFHGGGYQEVVELLSQYGAQGWEVVACVAVDNWVYWTLKHDATA